MRTGKLLKITLVTALLLLLVSSCREASNTDVFNRLEKDIRPGLDKKEILKYIDNLEINGIKADSSGYIKNDTKIKIPVNGRDVDFEGEITVSFRSKGFFYCGSFAILYFDKSGRLLRYVVDDIYC